MSIVISGGWRTGSTVMFNFVKNITGLPGFGASEPSKKEKRVYKIHCYTGDQHKIHTYRDYFDAARSMQRMGFDEDKIIKSVTWNYISDQINLRTGVFCVDYRELIENPTKVFEDVKKYLDSLWIRTKFVDYKYYTKKYQLPLVQMITEVDESTQYRANHISLNDSKDVELSDRVKRYIMSLETLEI